MRGRRGISWPGYFDHFKQVNDTYGHDRGDVVLREVAYQLRKELRSLDLVYRVGGEEFLVLLPGHGEADAAWVAQGLVAAIASRPLAGLPVTLSAGSATARGVELDYSDLARRADAALYAAKSAGRNQACARDEPVPVQRTSTRP